MSKTKRNREEDFNPYRDAVNSNRKKILVFILIAAICFVVFILYLAGILSRLVMNLIIIPIAIVMVVGYFKTRKD